VARKKLFGTDSSLWVYGIAIALIPTIVGIISWASRRARKRVGHAIHESWDWLIGPLAIPRVVVLAILGLLLWLAFTRRNWRDRLMASRSASPAAASLSQRAAAFRDAFENHVRALGGWVRAVRDMSAYTTNERANDEYREGKRLLRATYQDIAPELKAWLGRIDEAYTTPERNEPIWGDAADGPDESLESIFTKFWRPSSFVDAFGFWKPLNVAEFVGLAQERVDLLDSFVDSVSRNGDPRARP
jgi:hypothetical protein